MIEDHAEHDIQADGSEHALQQPLSRFGKKLAEAKGFGIGKSAGLAALGGEFLEGAGRGEGWHEGSESPRFCQRFLDKLWRLIWIILEADNDKCSQRHPAGEYNGNWFQVVRKYEIQRQNAIRGEYQPDKMHQRIPRKENSNNNTPSKTNDDRKSQKQAGCQPGHTSDQRENSVTSHGAQYNQRWKERYHLQAKNQGASQDPTQAVRSWMSFSQR